MGASSCVRHKANRFEASIRGGGVQVASQTRRYRAVRRYIKAHVEAVRRFKADCEPFIKVLAKAKTAKPPEFAARLREPDDGGYFER